MHCLASCLDDERKQSPLLIRHDRIDGRPCAGANCRTAGAAPTWTSVLLGALAVRQFSRYRRMVTFKHSNKEAVARVIASRAGRRIYFQLPLGRDGEFSCNMALTRKYEFIQHI